MICCVCFSIWLSFLNHYCQKVFYVSDLKDPFKTFKSKTTNSKDITPKKEKRSNLML